MDNPVYTGGKKRSTPVHPQNMDNPVYSGGEYRSSKMIPTACMGPLFCSLCVVESGYCRFLCAQPKYTLLWSAPIRHACSVLITYAPFCCMGPVMGLLVKVLAPWHVMCDMHFFYQHPHTWQVLRLSLMDMESLIESMLRLAPPNWRVPNHWRPILLPITMRSHRAWTLPPPMSIPMRWNQLNRLIKIRNMPSPQYLGEQLHLSHMKYQCLLSPLYWWEFTCVYYFTASQISMCSAHLKSVVLAFMCLSEHNFFEPAPGPWETARTISSDKASPMCFDLWRELSHIKM